MQVGWKLLALHDCHSFTFGERNDSKEETTDKPDANFKNLR